MKEASKGAFKRHKKPDQDFSDLADKQWDHRNLPFDTAKNVLDGILDLTVLRPWSFRQAVSLAIHREDLARVVYRGHATPAARPVSPANKLWVNTSLKAPIANPQQALALLRREGFGGRGRLIEFFRGLALGLGELLQLPGRRGGARRQLIKLRIL